MELPINSIIMWFKSTSLIPAGWVLCDGGNGTPDLRGKFIMGVAEDAEKGAAFGAENHVHTNSKAQAADDHLHDVKATLDGTVSSVEVSVIDAANSASSRTHTHVVDIDSAYSGTHEHDASDTNTAANLPPFVQVYYIMRIA